MVHTHMENQAYIAPVTDSVASVASDACDASVGYNNTNKKTNQNKNASSSFGSYLFGYVEALAVDIARDSGRAYSIKPADAAGLMLRLRKDYNLALFIGDDGIVHGRLPKGVKLPDEAKPLIAHVKANNDMVAAVLRCETVLTGVAVEEALRVGELLRGFRVVMTSPVVYHRQTGLCDLRYLGAQSAPA